MRRSSSPSQPRRPNHHSQSGKASKPHTQEYKQREECKIHRVQGVGKTKECWAGPPLLTLGLGHAYSGARAPAALGCNETSNGPASSHSARGFLPRCKRTGVTHTPRSVPPKPTEARTKFCWSSFMPHFKYFCFTASLFLLSERRYRDRFLSPPPYPPPPPLIAMASLAHSTRLVRDLGLLPCCLISAPLLFYQ